MESTEPKDTGEKKTTSKSQKDKKKFKEIIENLIAILDGFESPLGIFPRRFRIARDAAGYPLWLEKNKDDVIWLSSNEAVLETLQKYILQVFKAKLSFEPHIVRGIVETWSYRTEAINLDLVPVVQQKSDKGLTWHRLDFDFTDGPTPFWDEILSRMENAEAFLAWWGSLFVVNSDRAQAVWLSGAGDNSKGVIIEMLSYIFGVNRGFKAAEPWKSQPSPFWRKSILGARVICFNECNDPKFPLTEGFKSLTGDKYHQIEGKFAHAFAAELNCKILIASNEQAEISGEHSETKRLIPCPMQSIDPAKYMPLDLLKAKLIEELPAFCFKALRMYNMKCPNRGRIGVNESIIEDWVEKAEEKYQAMFDLYFTLDPNEKIDRVDLHKFKNFIDVKIVSNIEFGKFIKFLSRKGIKRIRPGDRSKTYYVGMGKSRLFMQLTANDMGTGNPANGHSVVATGRDLEPDEEKRIKDIISKGQSGIADWVTKGMD